MSSTSTLSTRCLHESTKNDSKAAPHVSVGGSGYRIRCESQKYHKCSKHVSVASWQCISISRSAAHWLRTPHVVLVDGEGGPSRTHCRTSIQLFTPLVRKQRASAWREACLISVPTVHAATSGCVARCRSRGARTMQTSSSGGVCGRFEGSPPKRRWGLPSKRR